jgi:RimJ/RimL family protein N-acetyltransferase
MAGPYSEDRARAWIMERDREGTTLLVVETDSDQPVGLMILFESVVADGDLVDVRLGYLLAESAWGRGFASELVERFVIWCRRQRKLRSIAGGVERGNAASARVLTKNGFVPRAADIGGGSQVYELALLE